MVKLIKTGTLKRTIRAGVRKVKKSDIAKLVRNSKLVHSLIKGPLAEIGEDATTLFAMIKDVSKGSYRDVPRTTILSGAFALLYALNPFDLMPDFVPGIGYLDDVSVFMLIMNAIRNDLDEYRMWTRDRRSITRRIKSTVADIKHRALGPRAAEA